MPRIKLDGPEGLEKGDRVFIDGEFIYEVIDRPTVPWSGNAPTPPPLEVPVRYYDGGRAVRVFDADTDWSSNDDIKIEVER